MVLEENGEDKTGILHLILNKYTLKIEDLIDLIKRETSQYWVNLRLIPFILKKSWEKLRGLKPPPWDYRSSMFISALVEES